jgi:hypothetical protein
MVMGGMGAVENSHRPRSPPPMPPMPPMGGIGARVQLLIRDCYQVLMEEWEAMEDEISMGKSPRMRAIGAGAKVR